MSQPPNTTPYKKGDFIGQKYEVFAKLGSGGFGIVYLVYSHETKSVYALKTFRDEYMEDEATRERFRKEARLWVDLERHPYLVRAYAVDEVKGRLYIAMEHIADDGRGLNTLEGYLRRSPPGLAQSLRWSIQFCYGMEYAYSRGIRAHRDIKPANIMISQDKTVKITDFGLAGILSTSGGFSGLRLSVEQGGIGLSGQTMEGTSFGTPTHMPPEQFTDAASCDETSDIYAFGVVLYQMTSGGNLPFLASLPRNDSEEEMRRFWKTMQRLHSESSLPRLDSPAFPVVRRCLEKKRSKRLQSFRELRSELESFLRSQTGEVVKPPETKALEAWEWVNKGYSLNCLGLHEEAIPCFDRALEIEPRDALAWFNKGISLNRLDRNEGAIPCYDRALEIDPRDADAWTNRGYSLIRLGHHEKAISCFDRALDIDPRSALARFMMAMAEEGLGRKHDAVRSYRQFLASGSAQDALYIEYANQRLQVLEGE